MTGMDWELLGFRTSEVRMQLDRNFPTELVFW